MPKKIVFAPDVDQTLAAPKKDEILATLRSVLPILRGKYHVRTIAIFGSVARDETRPDSDVNLLVSCEPRSGTARAHGDGDLYLRTVLAGREVDLVDEGEIKPELRQDISKDLMHVDQS